MDNEKFAAKIQSISQQIDAEIAALAVNDELAAAVRALDEEEARLKQRYVNQEITKDQYFALWHALMERTPHGVILASIKLTQAVTAALRKPPDSTEA
jgi:hypothetical protein